MRRLFSWALVGQAIFALGQWAVLVLILRVLTPAEAEVAADRWVFALALCAPFVLFTRADMCTLVAADAQERFSSRTYVQVRSIASLVMWVVVVCVAAVVAADATTWRVVAWLALARVIEGWIDIGYGHFQRAERQDWQARSEILRAVFGTGLGAVVLWKTSSLEALVAVLAGVWAAVLLLHDLPLARRVAVRHPPGGEGAGAKPGASATPLTLVRVVMPLAFTSALISLNSNLPRYVIEELAPDGVLGVFGSVAYVLVALALINAALRGATLPKFAARWAQGDRPGAGRVLAGTLAVAALPGLAIAAVAAVWGGELLVLLYNPSFSEQGPLLVWLSLAAVAGGLAGTVRSMLTAVGKIKSQVPSTLAAALLTGLCAWIWVPSAPFLGAAYAVLAGRLLMLVIHAVLLRRAWRSE